MDRVGSEHLMRLLLIIALLCGTAHAQTAPPPFQECIHKSIWTPFGTGTDWVSGLSEAGGVTVGWWGWWCPQSDGVWRDTIYRCVRGRGCMDLGSVTAALDTASRSVDPLQALRDVRDAVTAPPLDSELEAWEFAKREAISALLKIRPKPPAPAYVVAAATAADGTRPAYLLTNGVRGTISVGRAIAGQPCDPAKGSLPSTSGGLWAVFGPAFDPARVALCVKP